STESRLHVRPPHDITGRKIAPDLETLERSPVLSGLFHGAARRLSAASNTSEANAIWPWGQGRSLFLPDFREVHGLKGAVISAVDLVKGLGGASNMTVLDVPGATGLLDTNYAGKVEAALDFLKHGDFVYLHVEAPDECGHAGNRAEKIEAVARFDAQIVGPLRRALEGRDVAFFITCDHLTPLRKKTHVSDPVPFLLHHPKCLEHTLSAFTEKTAAKTGLFIDPGHATLEWVRKKILS
ncbi:MAG: cofactor-independent phosphoglycerate mutase, partial [Thermodesulfobacteriota bacterium]|nr:cofactor-independent phosphoglycerate mutase [Thermodesulfobacteriota bacterium]